MRFVRMACLWAFGSSCLDTLSDAFFLENIGAPLLPRTYLAIALGMIVVSSLVLYALKSLSPYRILTIAMGFGIAFCALSALLMSGSPPDWFWYALKTGARMFFCVMIAVSWTFIDQYHDLQDAKRVYSLYSAAYFFGTILSGSAISLCLDAIGAPGLLFFGAASIFASLLEARKIAFQASPVHDDSVEGVFSGSRDSFSSVVSLILRSRFAISLLLLSLFTQLLITVTEFNYMQSFAVHEKGHIAEFLGTCRAWISLCNIVIGLFVYSRFVRRTGLQNVILVTPLFFGALYAGWIGFDSILFAVLGLVAVDGILFTIEDNCFNLLSNAVPSKLKSKVRIVNDSFFEPIGMLISSLLLLAMQAGAKWLGLGLTAFILLLTWVIRQGYPQAILANLKDNAIHFELKFKTWLNTTVKRERKEALSDLFKSLQLGSEESQLLAIEGLLELGDAAVIPQIVQAANRMGTIAKIQVLRLAEASSFASDADIVSMIDVWINTSVSPELTKWASLYLAKRGFFHPEDPNQGLEHSDLLLRGASILALRTSPDPEKHGAAKQALQHMLQSTHIDEVSVALDLLDAPTLATPLLGAPSILVQRAAARCIARTASVEPAIANALFAVLRTTKDNQLRLALLEAIQRTAPLSAIQDILLLSIHFRPNERRKAEDVILRYAQEAAPLLLQITKDVAFPDRARILAGKILGRLNLSELQAHLIDIVDIEIERAYFYFYFGHTIQKNYPLYDLGLLQNALLTGYSSVIDFIIHLLGAAGSLEDPSLLVRALHSKNAKIHSHAIESLERSCDPRLFRLIVPLIDDLPPQEKMAACLRWQGHFPKLTLLELLDQLEESPTLFDKIVATRLKAELQMPGWRQRLREKMKRAEPAFHQFATELLKP